ncbi:MULTISPECIES: BrnA antitoxin family protein [unclassified Aureimonas]|uniref:BrnA antitoxin family protein n=1 Tax=unclassified Aureimonas TaxID=2615206 RepID=UPI0006FC1493|nr:MULTISPECIES: BrnA antitoxin family protein [unclassified Aureimonas]KQT69777.1 hypothetical protein ASG62_01285 [Aureimonas sp. Leaf427]KQT76071.1 hypothetical protein ASG54_14935 [Aureimonas sp. Leaf460]
MNAKPEKSAIGWVDPDDAPEWTDEMFERADLHENGVLVRRGRPPLVHPKERLTIRVDHDVAEALRASGKGWQTRLNAALRKWVTDGPSEPL